MSPGPSDHPGPVEHLSAVTLATASMPESVAFYSALGLVLLYGGGGAAFTSFRIGAAYLNLQLDPGHSPTGRPWGRVILWVDDVDAVHARAEAHGLAPMGAPVDAPWGERFFHIRDPAGHEISLARPL